MAKMGCDGAVHTANVRSDKCAFPNVRLIRIQFRSEGRSQAKINSRKLFADCSVDDGRDAYKLMALGADAVSVGRAILPGLLKDGKIPVEKKIEEMNRQLRELMGYTGVAIINDFDPTVLWYHRRHL